MLGATYQFVIAADNAVQSGGNTFPEDDSANLKYSDALEVTVANTPAIVGTPTRAAGSLVKGTVRMAWTAPSTVASVGSPIASYTIRKDAGAGAFYSLDTVSGSTLEYTDTGLVPTQSYSYQVYATNVAGDGPASATFTAIAGQEPGKAPQPKIVSQSKTTLVLEWDATLIVSGGPPITSYTLATDDGDYVYTFPGAITVASGTQHSYTVPATITGPAPGVG